MEGAVDGGDGAFYVQDAAVGGDRGDGEALRSGPVGEGVVVGLGGGEGIGELGGSEVLAVEGAPGVLDLLEEGVAFGLVAKGKGERELEVLLGGERAEEFGLTLGDRVGEVEGA